MKCDRVRERIEKTVYDYTDNNIADQYITHKMYDEIIDTEIKPLVEALEFYSKEQPRGFVHGTQTARQTLKKLGYLESE